MSAAPIALTALVDDPAAEAAQQAAPADGVSVTVPAAFILNEATGSIVAPINYAARSSCGALRSWRKNHRARASGATLNVNRPLIQIKYE